MRSIIPLSRRTSTLLEQALVEGVADFVSELAIGPWHRDTPRQRYGAANERAVWIDFEERWRPTRRCARSAIAEYYRRADDRTAAIRELILLRDPGLLLEESGCARYAKALPASGTPPP